MQAFHKEPDWLTVMADGTVKQLNPFSGTEVWTVAGRGNRPLGVALPPPIPLDPEQHGRYCPFCEQRYLETPPEKSRVVRGADGNWRTLYRTSAEDLFATTAEFRRVPNLFEILSFQYWHANYGYALPARVAARELSGAMRLMMPGDQRRPPVLTCSAQTGDGLDGVWDAVLAHRHWLEEQGSLEARRAQQQEDWMWAMVDAHLHDAVRESRAVRELVDGLAAEVRAGRVSAVEGTAQILRAFSGR